MLKTVVAIVFIVHGIGHILFFLAAWTSIPVGFTDRAWILPGDFTRSSAVGRVSGLIWLAALAGFVGAGVRLLGGNEVWQTLALAAAVVSLAVIVLWWNTVTPGSKQGAALVDVLTIAGLFLGWGGKLT
jgi:hypothetical protein